MKNYGMVPNEKDIKGVFFAIFTHLSPSSRGGVTSMTDIVEELVPFEGVVMGPIIGKGSFGSVFKATLHKSKMVAIKASSIGWSDVWGILPADLADANPTETRQAVIKLD